MTQKTLSQRVSSEVLGHFLSDKIAISAAFLLLIVVVAAVFAPWIASTDPYDLSLIDIMDSQLPPAWMPSGDARFLLGTDDQGRDLFSAILYGARISLLIGVGAVILQAVIGVVLGLLAGYFGGWLDTVLMRMADVQLSFSTMMVGIIAAGLAKAVFAAEGMQAYQQNVLIILILVIGFSDWPQYARSMRASVLAQREQEYVQAAKVMGFGSFRIMVKHILPNCLSPVVVISTVQVANAIMAEAALSFLGLGMPVEQPSLGSLIRSGYEYIFSGQWWITLFPGVVLVALVLSINLLGDWLRDALNPKSV